MFFWHPSLSPLSSSLTLLHPAGRNEDSRLQPNLDVIHGLQLEERSSALRVKTSQMTLTITVTQWPNAEKTAMEAKGPAVGPWAA